MTPGKPKADSLPKNIINKIIDNNQFDMILYEEAKKKFEQQVKKYPNFQREVIEFQRINNSFFRRLRFKLYKFYINKKLLRRIKGKIFSIINS